MPAQGEAPREKWTLPSAAEGSFLASEHAVLWLVPVWPSFPLVILEASNWPAGDRRPKQEALKRS